MATAETLGVWLADRHVADLTIERRGGLSLTYTRSVQAEFGIGALCLSVALPVAAKAHVGVLVDRWANGILPEGEARTVLEDHFEVRRGDTWGLLRALGRDCAGAISFYPDGEAPTAPGPAMAIGSDALAAAITDLPVHPLGTDDETPVSLAGLQAKLLLVQTADGWARPTNGQPSTHILKPDPFSHQGLVSAEALCLRAATYAGIAAATVSVEPIAGRDVLIVERFDRQVIGGHVERLHQEDCGQALGCDPARDGKYQRPGRRLPTLAAIAQLLMDHSIDAYAEHVNLAQLMTLNIAAGNTDAHARNHGLLITGGTARLAPAYDVAPAVEFSNTKHAAMWVSGQDRLEQILGVHLRLEAASWGPLRRDAGDIIATTATRLADAFETAHADFPAVADHVVQRMRDRARKLGETAA